MNGLRSRRVVTNAVNAKSAKNVKNAGNVTNVTNARIVVDVKIADTVTNVSSVRIVIKIKIRMWLPKICRLNRMKTSVCWVIIKANNIDRLIKGLGSSCLYNITIVWEIWKLMTSIKIISN